MQTVMIDLEQRRDVLARAKSVTELLKAAAPRIEAEREMPKDVLAAMHEAQLFRLMLRIGRAHV